MRPLRISRGRSRYDHHPQAGAVSWEQLTARLQRFTTTDETFAAYKALDAGDKLAVKDVGFWVGGVFEPSLRRKHNLRSRSVLTLDLDHLDLFDEDEVAASLAGVAAVLHSTHAHSSAQPRLRLVAPLSRDVGPVEYEALGRRIASHVGMQYFDPTGFQVSRIMFWPSRSTDGDEWVRVLDGAWLDPDAILAEYEDWRDFGAWPTCPGEQQARDPQARAEPPWDKPGIIGAFCRTFSVPDAIDVFDLPYTPSGGGDGRYSLTTGTSADGAIYYEEDGHLYSWHESDPARGNHNAWDLVRLHRFGRMDTGKDLPLNQRESQRQMKALAASMPEVMAELAGDEGFDVLDKESDHEDRHHSRAADDRRPRADRDTVSAGSVGGPEPDRAAGGPGRDGPDLEGSDSEADAAEGLEDEGLEALSDEDIDEDLDDLDESVRLTFEALRGYIDSLGKRGPIGDIDRRKIIIKIASSRLPVSQQEILAAMIRDRHAKPAPSRAAIMLDIRGVAKMMASGGDNEGVELADTERLLLQEFLREHYGDGLHLRRFGKQYWAYECGVWRTAQDEFVYGRLQQTLFRLREERPADMDPLVAAVTDGKTSALTNSITRMLDRETALRTGDGDDPMGLRGEKPAVINCLNGEIHFDHDGRYAFQTHNPLNYFTAQVPVLYDKDADCPGWDRFCGLLFSKYKPQERAIMQRHLEELGGYLIQYSRWLKTWVLFHGETNAGKTTIAKVFSHLLGPAVVSRPLSSYDGSNSHAEAGLVGKLMLLDEDFAKGSLLPDGFIKKVSEAKEMTANPKGKDEYSFTSLALPVVISNHWPPTRDTSDAFRMRALVWNFPDPIPEAERDDAAVVQMLTTDMPGILRRFVEAFSRLRARGAWAPPKPCTAAKERWVQRSDSVQRWRDDVVAVREGEFLPRRDAYSMYLQWCRDEQCKPVGKVEWGERLNKIVGAPLTKRKGIVGWPDIYVQAESDDVVAFSTPEGF